MIKKFLLILFVLLILFFFIFFKPREQATIKVGILHSRSGTMALSEEPVIYATLLAINEINNNGGLLGKKLEPIIANGKSDWPTFAAQAEKLIKEDKVVVIFGCWTSASRKEVKPIVEKYNHLLFYPVQYEGIEQSPNIIYTGAAPNQQIIPGAMWCLNNFGTKVFLVGSDYVFPRISNEILKELISQVGGTVVGENYIKLGDEQVQPIMDAITKAQPDFILNTINGDSNVSFFKFMNNNFKKTIPIMSFSFSETDIETIGLDNVIDTYACWNYFETIQSDENKKFIQKIKSQYGNKQAITDPMEAAYFGVHLWANAVKNINDTDPTKIKKNIGEITFDAPEGIVQINTQNQHTWKNVYIGKVNNDSKFDIVWKSISAIKPEPYPNNLNLYAILKNVKTKEDWEQLLNHLYASWGGKWAAE